MKSSSRLKLLTIVLTALIILGNNTVLAHCDGLDGPVVLAAKQSLETENVNHVLIWIQKNDESEIIKLFNQTLTIRNLNPQVKEIADMHFFETVVRVHRAGEGEPYTGLKPAGQDKGHIIPAADNAIINGSVKKIKQHLIELIEVKLQSSFDEVIKNKNFSTDDVDTGRNFVGSYVEFLHFSEKLYSFLTMDELEHKH